MAADPSEPSKAFSLLERNTVAGAVRDSVERAILNGQISSGDQLVELQIAEQMGVSRGPVREALVQLQQMGLVQRVAYKGWFVASLSEDDVRELYSVRTALETQAVRDLPDHLLTKAAGRLEEILAEMERAAESGDLASVVQLDLQFHDELVQLSGNRLLRQVWETVHSKLERFLVLKERLYQYPPDAVTLHAPIARALKREDREEAIQAVIQHVQQAAEQLLDESSLPAPRDAPAAQRKPS